MRITPAALFLAGCLVIRFDAPALPPTF